MSKKNAKNTKVARAVDDSPPVPVVPPATEREEKMLADLRKWELRARTLQRQVDLLVQDVKRLRAMSDLVGNQIASLATSQLTAQRFREIEGLVGKPIVYCPVCYKLRLSDTGKSGTQLCSMCSTKAGEELWEGEPHWLQVGNTIVQTAGDDYIAKYGLAR